MDGRTAGNDAGAFAHVSAHGVFVIASVSRQSNRDHEIVSVDYDESKKTGTVLVKEVYEIITEDDSREKTFQNRYVLDIV